MSTAEVGTPPTGTPPLELELALELELPPELLELPPELVDEPEVELPLVDELEDDELPLLDDDAPGLAASSLQPAIATMRRRAPDKPR
jgi:hypothetical protein